MTPLDNLFVHVFPHPWFHKNSFRKFHHFYGLKLYWSGVSFCQL